MKRVITLQQREALLALGVDLTGLSNKQVYKLVKKYEAGQPKAEQPDPYKEAVKVIRHSRPSILSRVAEKGAKAWKAIERYADGDDIIIETANPEVDI